MTKSQKKHLQNLAAKAHEIAMKKALNELRLQFNKWEQGEIDPWELNESIHKYHDGTARDIWKIYNSSDPTIPIAISIKKGIIKLEDVREDCRVFFERFLTL